MGSSDSDDQQRLSGVTKVNDNDIICGRGGLALKHPGNMAYRKIVGLNKELYATCLKTEKLRISKSIVAAIREINGRFLEREDGKTSQSLQDVDENGDPVTWKDIGDKRAVEKTSQALREGQPKLLKKLAAQQESGNSALPNGLYGQHMGLAPGAQMMPHQQLGNMQGQPLQQVAPNNYNQILQGGIQAFGGQQQQQQQPTQQFQAQQRQPSITLASLVEGQAFASFPRNSFVENGMVNGPMTESARRAANGSSSSWHDSWGSEGPSPLPTQENQKQYERSGSGVSGDSWGGEDPLPLGTSHDHVYSNDEQQQLMSCLGVEGGDQNGQHAGGMFAKPGGNKRASVKFHLPQRPSMGAMSLTSHLSELSIFSHDALSLDSAMDAHEREAEFEMLGEFDGTELMSLGTFESPDHLSGSSRDGDGAIKGGTPKPRRSILRKSNKWTNPTQAAAFPPQPLNSQVDPGMIFTSTLDTKAGGVNAGTDVSGLLGERRKSVVAFEVDVQRRRSSRMSMCSALTDFSGIFKRDIGSVLSIQSADFRELMADIDSDTDDEDDKGKPLPQAPPPQQVQT